MNTRLKDISPGYDPRRFYHQLHSKYGGYTMVMAEPFVTDLELCDRFRSVEGDFVECGVWRGGMSAAIAEVLGKDRMVHLFDSFEGLPPAQEIDGAAAIDWQRGVTSPNYFDNCRAEDSYALEAMAMAGHTRFEIHRGWFEHTVPKLASPRIGILRLDGDWYESITTCLTHLFPKVSEGGLVVLDDYYTWDGCSKAVHDYLSAIGSPSRIYQANGLLAYIVKKS
jgi:O-methyltransferase